MLFIIAVLDPFCYTEAMLCILKKLAVIGGTTD